VPKGLGAAEQMKKAFSTLTLLILLTAALWFPGCARVGSALNGSGKIIEQDMKIADFNGVEVKGAFILEIVRGESPKVIICTDDNLVNRVKVSLEHKIVKIGIEAPANFFPTSLIVKITMSQISGLNLSGGAKALLKGFQSAREFSLVLAEGSILNGSLEAGVMDFTLSGASQVVLKGTATKLDLDCKDASKLDLGELALTSAHLKLRGASEATLNVGGEFVVLLSDASKLYYIGNPLFINTYITGGSTMIRQDETETENP
jgi:hypothetical protein